MINSRLIKSNNAGAGACTNTVDLYNPFPDGGGVALYQLNGDATDVSGNYDGTASNVTYGTGQFGQAGVFNGSSSKVLASVPKSSSQSFSFWTKHGTQSNSTATYLGYSNTASNGFFSLCISSGNFSILYWNGSTYARNTSTTSITDNTWHHVVLTTVGNVFTIYLDGNSTPVYTTTLSGFTHATRSDLQISFETPDGAASYFNGSIDQVRIFNRALRPYEVEALYTEEYCTPTIVPSEHFNTVLYTGNGSTQSITGVGFEPDLVWAKARSASGYWHVIADKVRGVNNTLASNETAAERTGGRITSFDSDGFGVNVTPDVSSNASGVDYVSWNFKAGGAAVTNTDGTITSQVSANTEAGFSVVSYTGGNSIGTTVGHGLGKQLDMLIVKNRNDSTDQWITWHKDVERNSTSTDTFTLKGGNVLALNLTNSTISYNYDGQMGSIGGENLIAYCFAEVEGFSSFGSYVGTGAAGNTIVTGFEPAFVMIKLTDSTGGNWQMMDNKRGEDKQLYANLSNAEGGLYDGVDFLENGFQLKTDYIEFNGNGNNYIYMAFAADPTAVEPTLEDSFNTVLWTGNNSTRSITGVGFQPDLVWTKARTAPNSHTLMDVIRTASHRLFSNATNAESTTNGLLSFDSDGFSMGNDATSHNMNASGVDYVAWNWKGAEIPAINSNGSIPSVVSANPAAGFSIVSYTGNGGTATIGHGLSSAPSMLIIKNRSSSTNWVVGSNEIGWNYSLNLNDTSAAGLSTNRFNSTSPTSSVFSVGATSVSNGSGNSMIAYCFAEVAGFSKFGSYTGIIASGNPINVGFEPAFILVKRYNATENWVIFDNKRGSNFLMADRSDAEINASSNAPVFTSTGFYFNGVSTGWNSSGNSYIYMAFANQF